MVTVLSLFFPLHAACTGVKRGKKTDLTEVTVTDSAV